MRIATSAHDSLKTHSRRRAIPESWVVLAVASWLGIVPSALSVQAPPETAAQTFFPAFDAKAFLTKTPPIYRIVFQVLKPQSATPPEIYEAGVSDNSFFIRGLDSIPDLTPGALPPTGRFRGFAGASGNIYWQVSISNDVVSSAVPAGQDPSDNATAAGVRGSRTILDPVKGLHALPVPAAAPLPIEPYKGSANGRGPKI